jgi:flagellar motor component MotA
MNIIPIIIIISLINTFVAIDINYSKYKLKNCGLRLLVFKKKNVPKIINTLKEFYNKCSDKSIVSIAEGINEYNNTFTEEEKIIIETLLALCY